MRGGNNVELMRWGEESPEVGETAEGAFGLRVELRRYKGFRRTFPESAFSAVGREMRYSSKEHSETDHEWGKLRCVHNPGGNARQKPCKSATAGVNKEGPHMSRSCLHPFMLSHLCTPIWCRVWIKPAFIHRKFWVSLFLGSYSISIAAMTVPDSPCVCTTHTNLLCAWRVSVNLLLRSLFISEIVYCSDALRYFPVN